LVTLSTSLFLLICPARIGRRLSLNRRRFLDKIQSIVHSFLNPFCQDGSMFGFGKNKSDKRKKPKELQAGRVKSQRLREEALANARAARETLGDETVQKIAEIIARKENNPFQQAIRQLESADSDRVADEILYMLDEK